MKVILLVDIQEGYIDERLKDLPQAIERHIKSSDYDVVIATRFINNNESLHKNVTKVKEMTVFSQKAKLVPSINQLADFVLMRSTYTSITGDVTKLLERNEVKQVYITGLNVETSILVTAVDLFDKGIKPIILSSLCNTASGEEINRKAMEILRLTIGDECIVD